MQILKFLLLIITIISCNEKKENQSIDLKLFDKSNDSIESDINVNNEDCHLWLSDADTVLSNGTFIRYIIKDQKVRIEWGNKKFRRILTNSYECDGAPSWVPTIRWSTSKYIGLKYGCGSPCWGTIILPLNDRDSVIERMYDLEKDLKNNKIVYLDYETYDKLIVENFETGNKINIKYTFNCKAAFTGYCIDTLTINNDSLTIRWLDWKDDGKTSIYTTEKFKINE